MSIVIIKNGTKRRCENALVQKCEVKFCQKGQTLESHRNVNHQVETLQPEKLESNFLSWGAHNL